MFFPGTLNGNGYLISNILINEGNSDEIGGFIRKILSTGVIKNIGFSNFDLTGNTSVGGICVNNYGTISNCYFKGILNGYNSIGGICAVNYGTISNCYANGELTGFIGIGGVCHINSGSIQNCYTACLTTITSPFGFYAAGICASSSGDIKNCYWDTQFSTISFGLTTLEMQTKTTFTNTGWDFIGEADNGLMDIWYMPLFDYPRFYWETTKGDLDCDGSIGVTDFSLLIGNWLELPQQNVRLIGDVNGDDTVDILDYAIIASGW